MPLASWTYRFPAWPAIGWFLGLFDLLCLFVIQVLIKHRATDGALALVEDILRPLGSRFVYLSYDEHDLVTANTQAVTHAAFLR